MRAISFLLCLILGIPCLAASAGDWLAYGGNAGDKFSRLDQINLKNVGSLKAAWTYHTGDEYQPKIAERRHSRLPRSMSMTPCF